MSLVMPYFLFWMIFIHKQECAAIRLDQHNRNTLEFIIQKYMNPLRKLSADLPNHAIEMEIEILGSNPKAVTKDQRRFIRLINPRNPKLIPRTQDGTGVEEAPASGTDAANGTAPVAPDAGQLPPAGPPAGPPNVPTAPGPDSSDPQKIPVYMDDLKKALDELEKKLISNAGNTAVKPSPISNGTADRPQPVKSIDDILQLLKKAVHVEHRMPRVGDEKLEWVQIKIPKSMKL